jgi:hypothetical protein
MLIRVGAGRGCKPFLHVRGCLSVPRFTNQFVPLDAAMATLRLFSEALRFFVRR